MEQNLDHFAPLGQKKNKELNYYKKNVEYLSVWSQFQHS